MLFRSKYEGEDQIGIPWTAFRKKYVEMGGDGFYGAWSVPYLEPVIADRTFVHRLPSLYHNVFYKKGICPIAEAIQPKIMQFKANYRNLELAKQKADVLHKVIQLYH